MLATSLVTKVAHAEEPATATEPARVTYTIGTALPCLTAERIEARVAPMRSVSPSLGDRVLIDGDPAHVVVQLLREGDAPRTRDVSRPAGLCDDELVGTVAVIVATLSMPPDAPADPPADVPPPIDVAPTTTGRSRAPETSPPTSSPTTTPTPPTTTEEPRMEAPVEAPPPSGDSLWAGVSGGALLAIGMLPDPSFGLDVHAHVGLRGSASGRLGVTLLPYASVDAVPGAELTYASLDARVCTPPYLELPPMRLLLCAGPSVGFVRAIGTNVAVAHERFEVVADLAASLTAVFALVDEVAVGVELGGRALLVRPRFYVESGTERLVVHTPNEVVPWLAVTLFMGDPRPEPTPPPSLETDTRRDDATATESE